MAAPIKNKSKNTEEGRKKTKKRKSNDINQTDKKAKKEIVAGESSPKKIHTGKNLKKDMKKINKKTLNTDEHNTTKSSKRLQWKKINKKKRQDRLMTNTKSINTSQKKEPKRIHIPREVSNNWKALHQVIIKDSKPQKDTEQNDKERLSKLKVKEDSDNKSREKKDKEKKDKEKKDPKVLDIWFDGVDEMLLDIEARKAKRLQESKNNNGKSDINPLVKVGASDSLTKIVAMDCEMVGVGINGSDNMLARVSLVNKFGCCIYDKFVKPMEDVVDYRTFVSGITPENIKDGEEFFTVQKEVSKIIKGRLLVGHAINNDLKVLYLQHEKKNIRDTSKYKGYRSLFGFQTPSLKKLTKEVLGVDIQDGEHDSVQDAQAAMRLYTMYRKQWEKNLKIQRKRLKRRKLQDNIKS